MNETSLLLGAGFSVNKGYPTAKQLNKTLTELTADDFWVASQGSVILKDKEADDRNWYDNHSRHKHFLIKLIEYYREQAGEFNYEEFYDFYHNIEADKVNSDFDILCNNFRKQFQIDTNNHNLLNSINSIFNQLISRFLVDGEGNRFYKSIHHCKPFYSGYTGFLNCIEHFGNLGLTHIHTLNHDLFLETLSHSDWMKNELSDGFEEMGSKYYGKMKDNLKVRLSRFTNVYNTKFRLYKLHGSFDQVPFHLPDAGIDTYVKIKYGVELTELYKEIDDEKGGFKYINDWINYHPDFLSGTTSKILRYGEPYYYDKVFSNFKHNLSNSNRLVIIGYGCGDSEINNMIEKYFKYQKYPIIIVDPYPSELTKTFVNKFKANLITKTPDELTVKDCV